MQFYPASCHFIPFRSKYSCQHPVLKHHPVHPLIWETKFTSIQNNGYICEISSSHGGEYDVQSCLLGCTAV
jgi:hypothetical protein